MMQRKLTKSHLRLVFILHRHSTLPQQTLPFYRDPTAVRYSESVYPTATKIHESL